MRAVCSMHEGVAPQGDYSETKALTAVDSVPCQWCTQVLGSVRHPAPPSASAAARTRTCGVRNSGCAVM